MNTELGPDVWTTRDLLILSAIATMADEKPGTQMHDHDIESAIDMDPEDIKRALVNLSPQYVDFNPMKGFGAGILRYTVGGVTSDGLRAVGRWPSAEQGVERLLEALDQLIANLPEASPKQTKLKALRDDAGEVGKGVLTQVVSAVLTGAVNV